MTNLSVHHLARSLGSWLTVLALAAACALVLTYPPRSLRRLELNVGGVAKEVQCAWSRWVARRDGVTVLCRGNPHDLAVALTFDDGPHPRTCGAILDVLRREGVRATFFPVGVRLKQNVGLLERMVAEGHEVGNHTWDHKRLTTISPEMTRLEIRKVRDFVYERTGFAPTLVRPPGGSYDARALEICRDEGCKVCLWTEMAGDWKKMSADEIVQKVVEQVHPGSIILMHDEFMQTPQALPRIIQALRAQGYRFVTASEMLGAPPPPFERLIPPPRWNIASLP